MNIPSLKKMVLSLALVLGGNVAVGADTTSWAVPKNLHIYSTSGSTFVDLVKTGCSSGRYYVPQDHVEKDKLFSMLMAAQISNKEVMLRFDGCNEQGRGKIIGVYLK